MTLKSKPLAALVVAIMFGGIFFSSAMGWWQTESTKEAAVFSSGEFAGQANPADIRGSYTFGDVEKNFNIPAALMTQAFGVVSGAPAEFQVKELEAQYAGAAQEVGTASVRLFVAFYLGLPFDLSTDIYLPESAAAILGERSLTPEQAAYLAAHTVANAGTEAIPQPAATQAPASQPTPAAVEPQSPQATHAPRSEALVKGKTTFAELLAWGVSTQAIEQVLGMPMPDAPGMTVKDFCNANGLSFETVKPALQAEIDNIK
jgi:hypothetical protein